MKVEKDVLIDLRDGSKLAANVFLPDKTGKFPTIVAFTIYGKDEMWSEKWPGWGIAYTPNSPTVTGSTAFEAPDHNFWVAQDYAVVLVDSRGFGKSPGKRFRFHWDVNDHYDAIEWIASQSWCDGNIGMTGVSYLGVTQWYVAALNPPHLKAICPWEAFSDMGRDILLKGGIPETRFFKKIENVVPPINPYLNQSAPDEGPPAPPPAIENIRVPALICATWSDHCLHTRGSFWAYKNIQSRFKWLYTHGRQKWAEYYSIEALAIQKMFFDYFLKGTDQRILDLPKVRLEVRENLNRYFVRFEDDWPIPRTLYRSLYLNANKNNLSFDEIEKEGKSTYNSTNGKATFDIKFEQDTELTGHMKLKLWICPEEANDADIFVTLKKIDKNGNDVFFDSWMAPARYPVALGWLRLSQRELDPDKSTPWQPFLKHERELKVNPGEVTPCWIEILPSSTIFRKGEKLRLEISGRFQIDNLWHGYDSLVNKGKHSIYTGGRYDSHLLVPMICQ
jgi:predicted acyl esterase